MQNSPQICLWDSPTPKGWRIVRMSDVFSRVTRKIDTDNLPVLTISAKVGFMTQEKRYRRFMAGESLKRYIQLHRGEFAYNKGNSKTYPHGCVYPLKSYDKAAVPHVYFCFRSLVQIDADFFAQYFASGALNEQLARINNIGVRNNGLLNISPEQFFTMEIPLPPIDEQRKIATMLTSVDAAIHYAQAVIGQTRTVRQGLLQELMLLEADAVRCGESCRLPLLDQVAQRGSGHTPDKKHPEYWNGGVKWVSLRDSGALDRLYIECTAAEISIEGIRNSSAVLHPSGTVVLTRDASVGRSAILKDSMAVSQHFIAWQCGPELDNHYLYYWLQRMKPVFEHIAAGSTIKTIGLPFFKKLRIPLPPLNVQRSAVEVLLAADQQLRAVEDELAQLTVLKDGLMQDLLTGRVRIPTGG